MEGETVWRNLSLSGRNMNLYGRFKTIWKNRTGESSVRMEMKQNRMKRRKGVQ